MQLKTVVLPAPFGPIMAVMSPRARANDRSSIGDEPAEAHGQMLDLEHGDGRAPSAVPFLDQRAAHRLRSCRKTDGLAVGDQPRGFQIMTSTMARPNSSMRYWVGSKPGRRSA
jgi:hypothetical protein